MLHFSLNLHSTMVNFYMSKSLEAHSVEAFGKAAATGKEVDECVFFIWHNYFKSTKHISFSYSNTNASLLWTSNFLSHELTSKEAICSS